MSAALVAVTVHEPADVADNVEPDTEHPAVPAVVTAYDTAPVPEPPDVDNDRPDPNVPDVDDTDNAACDACARVTDCVADVNEPDE